VVKAWFQNCARRKGIKERFQLGRKFSVCRVVFREKADEIWRLVQEWAGVAPGHREYLGYFQRAVTEIMDEMSDNELEDMEVKRKEWEQEAYPADVQHRYIW